MNVLAAAALALALAQTAPQTDAPTAAPSAPSASESATEAARRAADAAQRAAEAAERSARAAEELARRAAGAAGTDGAAADAAAQTPPDAPGPAPVAEGDANTPVWAGTAGLSLISITGNAQTLTLSGTGTASRRTENWVLSARVAGAYGQSRVAAEDASSVLALNAMGQVRGDRRFTHVAAAYVLAGAETDHVKSIEYRALGEGGAAITWLERKDGDLLKLLLRTDLALRYQYESRFQYYPVPLQLDDAPMVAPKLGVGFQYALNQYVTFVEEAEVLLNILGDSRVLVTSLSRLNARMTDSVALSVGFQIKYDSLPAEGRVPTDTMLSVGVETSF